MTLLFKKEIPENIQRGLIAKGEGATWEQSAEIAKVSRYEMQRWREHPDAGNLISTAFNLSMEEAMGVIESNLPKLSKRLCEIGLDPKVKAYSATPAILGAFSIFQSGVIDRENKAKLNKLVEHLDRLEGEPQAIDI